MRCRVPRKLTISLPHCLIVNYFALRAAAALLADEI
jgi:hypothetical protein